MDMNPLVYVIPIAGLVGLLTAGILSWQIFRKDTGTPEMKAIGEAIREGAMAYLARQYKTIAAISAILGVIIMIGINWQTGVAFLIGAFFSALSGYIGMYVSVNANIRTASAAREASWSETMSPDTTFARSWPISFTPKSTASLGAR